MYFVREDARSALPRRRQPTLHEFTIKSFDIFVFQTNCILIYDIDNYKYVNSAIYV